jgi:opacity protein-like surface antigen
MKLRSSIYILLFLLVIFFYASPAYTERDNILLSFIMGYHYDVGNLRSTENSGYSVQHSLFLGLNYKADLSFFFLQLGLNKSFILSSASISDNSLDELKSFEINYYAAPMYLGINFPIKEHAKVYIGAGIVYYLIDGKVKTTVRNYNFNEIAFGQAITLGLQYRSLENIGIFIQWEYVRVNTAPVADIDSTNNWKNFDIDLTGSRTLFGLTYYIK